MELKKPEDILKKYKKNIEHWSDSEYDEDDLIKAIKEAQENAVEITLDIVIDKVDLVDNYRQDNVSNVGSSKFAPLFDYYIRKDSILDCKEDLFKMINNG